MSSIDPTDIKSGMKIELEGQPHLVISKEFVKPGKGQAFNRMKLKNMMTERNIEKNFRSGDKLKLADVEERTMRLIFFSKEECGFMDNETFDQITVNRKDMKEADKWLKEDEEYLLTFYNGNLLNAEPPIFMSFKIAETSEGARGDTASGRVMKHAILDNGEELEVPIFVDVDEIIKIDTRTGKYTSKGKN